MKRIEKYNTIDAFYDDMEVDSSYRIAWAEESNDIRMKLDKLYFYILREHDLLNWKPSCNELIYHLVYIDGIVELDLGYYNQYEPYAFPYNDGNDTPCAEFYRLGKESFKKFINDAKKETRQKIWKLPESAKTELELHPKNILTKYADRLFKDSDMLFKAEVETSIQHGVHIYYHLYIVPQNIRHHMRVLLMSINHCYFDKIYPVTLHNAKTKIMVIALDVKQLKEGIENFINDQSTKNILSGLKTFATFESNDERESFEEIENAIRQS